MDTGLLSSAPWYQQASKGNSWIRKNSSVEYLALFQSSANRDSAPATTLCSASNLHWKPKNNKRFGSIEAKQCHSKECFRIFFCLIWKQNQLYSKISSQKYTRVKANANLLPGLHCQIPGGSSEGWLIFWEWLTDTVWVPPQTWMTF